jgi:hypothetical protein
MYAIGKLSLESTALDHSAILPLVKELYSMSTLVIPQEHPRQFILISVISLYPIYYCFSL